MSPTPANPQLPPQSRIVVPIVAGIGNALLAVPMVRQIKRQRPDVRLTVIARTKPMAEPFNRLPELDLAGTDEVLVSGTGQKGQLRMIAWTRARKPRVYIVPFPSNRWQYNALAMTSGARVKLLHEYPAGHRASGGSFAAIRVPAKRGLHDVVQNLRLLEPLGLEIDASEAPRFFVTDADRAAAGEMLTSLSLGEGDAFLVMHAGSAQTTLAAAKRWPPARYASLIEAIHRELQLPVVLVEGPDEAGVIEQITAQIDSASDVRPLKLRGPLGHSAALLERAASYVGTDSGVAHLAAAVGRPAVTLFAPADPDRVCPFGNRHLVVQPPTSCAPCFLYPWESTRPAMRCSPPMCIESIEVDAVMRTLRLALEQSPSRV